MFYEQWIPYRYMTPYSPRYQHIRWNKDFNIVRFETIGDGSCLFHAIINGFFKPYHTETINGIKISRKDIICKLRKELSMKLPLYYDKLNNGNMAVFGANVPQYKLDYMQKELDSFTPLGYGYLEFIGNVLDKDIYILDSKTQSLYITDELSLSITGQRQSIVIYYINNSECVGHYELVGIQNMDGTINTHFHPSHPFIRFLNSKIPLL